MQKVLQRDIDKMKFHQSFDLRMPPNVVPLSTMPTQSSGQNLSERLSLINSNNTPPNSANNASLNTNNSSNSAVVNSAGAGANNNHSNSNMNNIIKAEQNELRIIIIDENWSQYCYRIKVNTPFGKLINRFCQQVKKIDNKSVLFWYQGKNVEDDDTPRTLQVKDGEVIFAHYIKS